MKKIVIIISLFCSLSIFAQTAGESGLSFLKFGFGARNIAMGDAGNAAANDLSALYYNPAKLSLTENSEVLFMHNEWIQDVRSEVFGIKSEIFDLPFALGFNVTNVSDIEVRTRPGEPESTFDANYFFGSLSSAFEINDDLAFGATLKFLYEGLLNDEATGWGFDFGAHYLLPVDGLTASAVVKNLGSMSALRNESTKLPTEIRVGVSYFYPIQNAKLDFIFAGDYLKYTSSEDNHFNLGLEISYDRLISLRGGYQTGFESRDFSAGIGLMWGSLRFDYAFLPFSLGLGNANLFSIQFKF